jgi:hypothetical protein
MPFLALSSEEYRFYSLCSTRAESDEEKEYFPQLVARLKKEQEHLTHLLTKAKYRQ